MLEKIKLDFSSYITEENIGYILYVIKTDDYIITAYNNKKGSTYSVTIQGNDPLSIAKNYIANPSLLPKKNKKDKESPFFIDVKSQIGSDEVGTGDFLGPVVVCAAYCDEQTLSSFEEYGITDSKKLTDEKVMRIVPPLLNKVHYEVKILDIIRYNSAKDKGFNLNQMKAVLHNFVLLNLHRKFPAIDNVYVDQFCAPEKYYEYLQGVPHVQKNIIFREKGETYFPSVALASCIARYYFLEEINKINELYNVKIPLGAGEKVDRFSQAFIHKFGIEEFDKIAKKSFANYKRLVS